MARNANGGFSEKKSQIIQKGQKCAKNKGHKAKESKAQAHLVIETSFFFHTFL